MLKVAKTYPLSRRTFGTLQVKNLYSHNFGYTETRKKVAVASSTAILAATAANAGTQRTLSLANGDAITQPDAPRALSVTPSGTTASVLDSVVEVFGENVEGKAISERFRFANAASTVVNGVKAFRRVTRIVIDGQAANNVSFSVGTQNKFGLNHRLAENNTTVKVYQATAVNPKGIPTGLALQGVPTVVANGKDIELNLVTPLTAPDSSTFLIICYTFDNWSIAPFQDQAEYQTSTSTSSTSSSTSTTITTSTSTSSTSVSTSSTSVSTSSTSSSTSSTSTSTTTVP